MISLNVALYIFIDGAMLMLSGLGLESAIVSPSLDRWSKRFFIVFFAILVACSATFFLELIAYLHPELTILAVLANFLDSIFSVSSLPMLTIYLLHCCGEDLKGSSLFRAMMALWIVYVGLLVVSQFTTLFYYVPSGNELVLGPAYQLLLVPVLTMAALVGVGVARRRRVLSRQYRRAFLICLLPVSIAIIIHIFVPVYTLINIGLTIAAFAMYQIIENDSVEQDLRQQREIANQRASIAVLQMRPHFIYNTMTSIYYLCDQDPKLAKQVTMDFTTYLRKNFTAIASKDTIPFSEELEHTRAYLAVEQAQFMDDLLVDYDTPHTQFRMPPLTLQPIVENAVKHGMDPESGPLHIWVRARETDSGSEVVVEDDGPGYVPAADDEPHIALANIEQRLDMMCGGRLEISPREGGGTAVKVAIPQQ